MRTVRSGSFHSERTKYALFASSSTLDATVTLRSPAAKRSRRARVNNATDRPTPAPPQFGSPAAASITGLTLIRHSSIRLATAVASRAVNAAPIDAASALAAARATSGAGVGEG